MMKPVGGKIPAKITNDDEGSLKKDTSKIIEDKKHIDEIPARLWKKKKAIKQKMTLQKVQKVV